MQVSAPSKYSLRAFAYEMLNIYYSGKAVDDKRLSIRQIEVFCRREASAVIKELALRDLMLGLKPDENLYTTFSCIDITDNCDDICDCSDQGIGLKSVVLPALLYAQGKAQIAYFGSQFMDLDFSRANSISQAITLSKGILGLKKKPSVYMPKERRIYFFQKDLNYLIKLQLLEYHKMVTVRQRHVMKSGKPNGRFHKTLNL